MLALSTAWNCHVNKTARQILTEIKETGLTAVELGYRLTHTQFEELIPILGAMQIKVSSIHNFCPLPYDGPSPRHASNYYRLSSLDETERRQAVQWTKNSIDSACRVNAAVVVIHAGTVELKNDPTPALMELYRQGKKATKEFAVLKEKLRKAREAARSPYLEVLNGSLKEVVSYAQKRNVKIGLETRYYPVEIPNYEEVGCFLDSFHDQGMFYWHDVGHAEVGERLGICPHADYFRHYKDRMIGMHIHGVKGLRDHQAPFDGDFDLTTVMPFFNGDLINVIESHAIATKEQIQEAIQRFSPIR